MELPWRLPLMQAPVGPAATPALVAAVSSRGVLGTLAASWTPIADLRDQVNWLRTTSDAPFCVNLVLAFDQRQRLMVALEQGTSVVSFSWGADRGLIRLARTAGAFVLVQVGDAGEAAEAVDAGADALIVQGVEAGGHVQASRPLAELLREVKAAAAPLPLVAAGGIGDAADVRDVLDAGAEAAACGTVFLAAEEADVHPAYLGRLIGADAADTTLTTVFDGGWPNAPHRVIRNDTVAAWEAAGRPPSGRRPGEGEPVASRNGRPVLRYDDTQATRNTVGEVGSMALYAGTSVRAVDRRRPASAIVERLTTGL